MSDTYRWTLDEYVLRCEDGSSVAEILTEGGLDRDVLADALDRWEMDHVTVLDADYVVVEPSELERAGVGTGVKATLLAIAVHLEERAADAAIHARVAVVVDRDYDGPAPYSRFLFETDGHSMESYALNEETLDRFLRLGLGRSPRASGRDGSSSPLVHTACGADLLARLLAAAVELAAVRLALRDLEPPLAPFERWTRYLEADDQGFMNLDGARLLERVLQRAQRSAETAQAEDARRLATTRVEADPTRLVRGHDFITILHKLLQTRWGSRIAGANVKAWSDDRMSRTLFMALPTQMLDATPLFGRLQASF